MTEVLKCCEIEILIILSRLIERYAIHSINQWIYGNLCGNLDQNAINGNVEYTKTISNKGNNIEIHQIWTVPNFWDLLNNMRTICLYSPKPYDEWKFQLMLQFGFQSVDVCYKSPRPVFLKSVQLKSFTFDTSLWVYNQKEFTIGTLERLIVEANTWYILKRLSIEGSYLQNSDKILFLKNGSLHLKFEFVVTIENGTKEDQFQIPAPQLSNDMEKLFLDGFYTDAVMKSADDKEFRVHKAVLANRCAVLKAYFGHKTTESITNIVESPLEYPVLYEVLLFIYTDKTPKLDEMPEKLLAAADYYQLSRLKSLCEEALHKKLTVDNAIETLQLADLHSADTLKHLTLKFIRCDDKQLQLITKTAGWAKLKSVDLMKRIYE